MAIDWTMPVLVGTFTVHTLQDDRLTDIGAQGKQSTLTGTADAEIWRNAWAMPQVSKQRSAGACDPNDSAHQGECERHSGPQPVRAETRMAHYAAIVCAVRIEDVHTLATNHNRPREASYH